MKTTALVTVIATAVTGLVLAEPKGSSMSSHVQGFPKNIARQHSGASLSLFDAKNNRYASTEAAAAWLDDDVATGWPALAGKQHYLLQFAEPQLVTNFELSTKSSSGTISLYVGDRDAAPGDKAWTLVAKDVPVEAINNQKLPRSLNKYAKYVLIETNIADSGSIYSVNVFGEHSAASTAIVKRTQSVDVKPLLGDFVNNQTAFNMAGIYAKASVSYANAGGANATWQRAIDDDSETSVSIKPSTAESGMVVRFDGSHPFSRLSLLTNPKARGKVDVFLLSEAPQPGAPVSLEGVTPSVSLMFDGASPRTSADFAETRASAMALRWTPESGEASFTLREVNAFADLNLSDYEVASAPAAISQGPAAKGSPVAKGGDDSDTKVKVSAAAEPKEKSYSDGKSDLDGKSPIALGPNPRSYKNASNPPAVLQRPGAGFLPGGLGFPPTLPGGPGFGPNPGPDPVSP